MKSKPWRHLDLVARAVLLLAIFTLPALGQNNPVPFINQPLVPEAGAPGGSAFILTVNGTGFGMGSVVNWNGSARTTTFVSGSQVTAAISAGDIATVGTAVITVVNPTPGGGASNVAFLAITNPTTSVTMNVASSLGTGASPTSVAVGDFNGDGNLDLAVANYGGGGGNTVSILLGDGMGSFSLASSPATGAGPISVAVGDFNGDGRLDLAVTNASSNTVSILLGDGAGNFSLASSPATGAGPISIAVGDFNGDGNLDLAAANSSSNTVSILLGDGTGNFNLTSSPPTGTNPYSIAVGDFNGNGSLDLAVANYGGGGGNTVSILLGDGTGNFSLASSTATGTGPDSVAVADFNGDGNLDLAVANSNSNTISILLGDGTGHFTLASSPGTGYLPNSVAIGDFNGDGLLDLAVANINSDTVSILLGDGTGNFSLASSPATGSNPYSAAAGDFNGGGRLDLAVANESDDTVSILLQVATVTLSPGSLNFGNQPVGTTSAPQTVTLTNSGSAPLTVSSISVTGTNAGDFAETSNCGTTVGTGASCTISVTFSPAAAGSRSAMVTIVDNAGNSPQSVPLTGAGTTPAVTLAPGNLNFGNQPVGTTSAAQTVTLTNSGTAPLMISGISAIGDFAQINTCGTTVSAGGSCTISVTFNPTAPGTRNGSVSIADNAQASPQTIALSGTGTAPAVTLTPTSLTFGAQMLGTTSKAQTVTLTNSGTETLTITSIAISGNFLQTNTCGIYVSVGGKCTISVTFAPAVINQQTGAVTITDNAYDSQQQMVSLTGVGTEASFSPASLRFQPQLVGTSSAAKKVTLTNVGATALGITGMAITGADAADFSQTNTCGSSLGAGKSCAIKVTFTPTAPGTRTASLSASDNGGGSPQALALSGTAIAGTSGPYKGLFVLPAKPTILVGTPVQLAAWQFDQNGTIGDATTTSNWTVLEPSIASVTNSKRSKGLAMALAPGQVLVEAKKSGYLGFSTLNVVSSLDLPPPGLTANASDGQVVLTWTALPNSTTFNVMRSITEGGPYTTIATVSTPSYTDTGLTDGTSYYYVVVANYQDGDQSENSHEAVGTPLAPGAFNVIQHIVYIIKENHSFDSFFGTFPGANGATSGMTSNGRVVQLQRLADPPPNDLGHFWKDAVEATDGGRMDRFDLVAGGNMNGNLLAYAQFIQADIPNYWSYASTFALADAMYSSISSGSYPGHLYIMAAQNMGAVDNPVSPTTVGGWGCDASADTTVPTITDTDPEVLQNPFPCYGATSLAYALQDAGVSWKSYAPSKDESGYAWNSLRAFSQIFKTSLWQSNVVSYNDFENDARSSNMPAVSWLTPDAQYDEHPVHSVCEGENWTVQQINAIMQGPNWNSTAIFIVWDDFGGFYDHVPPPSQDLYGYSIRVPFIIISPYAKQTVYGQQGYITHSTYEMSSVLRFIEERFGVVPLSSRDATANDILDAFDFSQLPLPPVVLQQRQCP